MSALRPGLHGRLLGASLLAIVAFTGVAATQTSTRPVAVDRRPRILLSTVRTVINGAGVFVDMVDRDGRVWERRLTENRPFQFSPAEEVKVAQGARAFGDYMVSLRSGGVVMPPPLPQLQPVSEWIRTEDLGLSRELPVAGQVPVHLNFPDRYLYSKGTLIQRVAPLGTRVETGRAAGMFVAAPVADFGIGRESVTALFADGSVVSVERGSRGEPECLMTRSAAAIAVGPIHSAAVTREGKVVMWGDLGMGQLARAGFRADEPVAVDGPTNIVRVALSPTFPNLAVALDATGRVWTWGAVGPQEYILPRRVAGLTDVAHVEYDLIAVALKKDGTAWAFQPAFEDPPVKVFDNVASIEELPLDTLAASPCWRGVSTTPPVVPEELPERPPASPGDDSLSDPPGPAPRPESSTTARPSGAAGLPEPFVISLRYRCEFDDMQTGGDVVVVTSSSVSCADAEQEHARLLQSRGGDVCAASIPGTHTAGRPLPSQQPGPCAAGGQR